LLTPALAELVRGQIAVIVCNVTAALAAKAVTSTESEKVSLPASNDQAATQRGELLGNALGAKQVELRF
jgi:ribosomal protein L10